MTFKTLLAADLDTARQAVEQLHPFFDPLHYLRRAARALGEIRAKLEPTPTTDHALDEAGAALNRWMDRLNTGLAATPGPDPDRDGLLAKLDALEVVLATASPNAMTRHLFGL